MIMAEAGQYAMTHSPPNHTDLALLNAFIDQRVPANLLRHKTRMFELLRQNGLIARSAMEQRFLSRILSIYAQTMVNSRPVGNSTNDKLESASLEIRHGELNGYPYVAIISVASKHTILRGQTRNTKSGAMESFIDTVLTIGRRFKAKIESQRDEYNETVRLRELEKTKKWPAP